MAGGWMIGGRAVSGSAESPCSRSAASGNVEDRLGLVAIESSPIVADGLVEVGVDRIMVDLESVGKAARQTGQGLRLSGHSLDDVAAVAQVIAPTRLMVRIDRWSDESPGQIEAVLGSRPGTVMLPMVSSPGEASAFVSALGGRARASLLIEQVAAVDGIDSILDAAPVDEVHVGLNDLRIDSGARFLFEHLVDGSVAAVVAATARRGIPCGVGGIARLDEGLVPGSMVLAEHVRIGSAAVILSRTFVRSVDPSGIGWSDDVAEMTRREVSRLRALERSLRMEPVEARERRHRELRASVAAVSLG